MPARYHRLVAVLATAWMSFLTVIVAALMAAHERPLAVASPAAAVAGPASGRWCVTHVLVDGCPCSDAVGAHLLARGHEPNITERVVILGDATRVDARLVADLRRSGFDVQLLDADAAWDPLGVSGGPTLLVDDPAGHRRYTGGYGLGRPSATTPAGFYQERRILGQLRLGVPVPALPASGCSVARSPAQVWFEVAGQTNRK